MRNLLILPLLVAPCFSAHSQLGELVGEVFLTYETCFTTVEIEGCTLGESYILQAEGLYTVWGGSCDKGDPAFDALDLGTPNPYSPWVWNDVCDGCQNNRPTPDVFNPDHVYQFPFVAQSETQSFHFQDTGGCSNNCGGIQFQIYRAAAPASPNHVPNEGLAYWSSFNGVAADESGNAISATAYGPHPTADRHGNEGMALAFDGEDDYVLLYADEGGTSFGESLTLAAWVRPQASSLNGTHPRIFNSTEGVGGGPDRWLFTWSPPLHGEKMQFEVDPSTGAGPYGSTPLPVGQWSHVAMTFDQGEVQFYLNGEADGTATLATTSLAHVSAPIQIGSANGNSFFQGDIDEVGMWSRALNATEIQALQLDSESEVDPVPSGCELFSIQTLAMQNLILLDSIATLNAALANASSSASGDDTNEWSCGDPIAHDGHEYSTTQIGDQCWFAENVRVLPAVWPSSATSSSDPRAYVYNYEGESLAVAAGQETYQLYGALYNYPARQQWPLCPSQWSVPTDEDWFELESHLGIEAPDLDVIGLRGGDQGTELKSTTGWNSGGAGTDLHGFKGLPGGELVEGQGFIHAGFYGFWGTSSLNSELDKSWFRELLHNHSEIYRHRGDLETAMSVRCVQD